MYPQTQKFKIVGTVSTPHPFCVNIYHLVYAFDHMLLSSEVEAIKAYENEIGKPSCGIHGCSLMFEEHETRLVVEIDDDREPKDVPELEDYLESCAKMCKENGYAGFTFTKKDKQ